MARTLSLAVGPHILGVTVNGSSYNLTLNNAPLASFKQNVTSSWFGAEEDFPVQIDGNPYILSVRKKNIRLVANGVYLDNNEPFVPAKPMPKWIWVFFILNLLIPIISLGGALNFLIGFAGASLSALVARSKIESSAVKVLLCVLITGATWAVWFVLMGAIFFARYMV